ncbi:MAG: hypothetical protein R3338_08050 [Thermoanaerobaculia bacterium]|nr:hypothetical protein [Thermoanaerobaculia bacterium]
MKMEHAPPPTIFLISPANLNGTRAKQLRSKHAMFEAAKAYRNGGVPIGQAFSFMSALYFRGKLTYARRFSVSPTPGSIEPVQIITAGYGLVSPDWLIDQKRMRRLQRTKIDPRSRTYRSTLQKDVRRLRDECDESVRFVLLGSVATGKYVDVLHPILRDRLKFPASFVGIGDMQRGSIMLNAARSGVELEYVGMDHVRSTAKRGSGGGQAPCV